MEAFKGVLRLVWRFRPFALARALALWWLAAGALYLLGQWLVSLAPVTFAGAQGSVLLYAVLVGLAILLFRSYGELARQRRLTETALELSGMNAEIAQGKEESRLLDFKARMLARLTQVEASHQLEREVGRRDRQIQQMVCEGKVSDLRQKAAYAGMQRELEYYKREFHRMFQENRWLKAALRQNHIDLAYLKEHVDRYLRQARPTMMARVKNLFTLSSPSPGIVQLGVALDAKLLPGETESPPRARNG
ncbi:MAG: hypothetical protein HY815_04730 [Candidatus Riflebacteria bacterium]|nr:hypothetical protein [Candidatus Riflebacteria bacterium]